MGHQIEAAGAFVLIHYKGHCGTCDPPPPISRSDRDVADVDAAAVFTYPIGSGTNHGLAEDQEVQNVVPNLFPRGSLRCYRAVELRLADAGFKCEQTVHIGLGCTPIGKADANGVRSCGGDTMGGHFTSLSFTARTGVSGFMPPLRRANVSRPVSSQRPSTAAFAHLSQTSLQSP